MVCIVMEAARMSLCLPHAFPTLKKTSLFLFSPPLLQNHTHLSLTNYTKLNLFCLKAMATATSGSGDAESIRPLTQFSPSSWGEHFLSIPFHAFELDAVEREIESFMKPKVRDMLMSSHSSDLETIRLIHLLINLGISYHFENEIDEILENAFGNLESLIADAKDDLETISITFEVFRLRGHYMSCDAFNRFKGEDGKLKESIGDDVRGMLQLYEAAHLGTPSEDIMDQALSFTRNHLEYLVDQDTSTHHLSNLIVNALYKSRYSKMEIEVARDFISFYQEEEGHDETLLKFAKLSFNFCIMHYVQELKLLTKWWKELDLASKLPYIRDRIVENFMGVLAICFEPRYSLDRIILAKLCMMAIVMDDTCDAYGTFSQVKSLVDSLERWDLGDIKGYSRIVVQSIFKTVEEIERERSLQSTSSSVRYLKEQFKSLGRAYLETSKWARTGHVPSFEEYIEVGIASSGIKDVITYSFMAMEENDENQTIIDWYESEPKILRAVGVILRLTNDINTFDGEMKRGEVANGVNCYMKQYGVTKEDTVIELTKMIRDHYKMAMEEFLRTTTAGVPRQILVRCINVSRVMNVFYKENTDGFTNPHGKLKLLITNLFLNPIPL